MNKKNLNEKKKAFYIGILITPAFLLCLMSCRNHSSQEEKNAALIQGDTVIIGDDPALADKIKIADVQSEIYSKEVITAGTIQAIPTQFAYIAPPFSGRVVKSYIRLGQQVRANMPLFEITSPDFIAIQKEFFQAKSNKELALNDLERKKDLVRNGVGSQRELEEASNALQIAEKEYENVYAALKIYQVEPKNMILGEPLIVRSPLSGEIITDNIVTGQYIAGDSEPIAAVADLSKVWVTAQVKEKDIRFIHEGEEMDIQVAALPGHTLKGRVFHIDKAVDETTRSIKVLSICENKNDHLKIGMYATVNFLSRPAEYIIIPEKALLQDEDKSYVYVRIAPGTFVKTAVEVETSKDGKAILSEGLKTGDRIIGEGGYYLK